MNTNVYIVVTRDEKGNVVEERVAYYHLSEHLTNLLTQCVELIAVIRL
jgi:hypothetical protein